MDPGGNKASRKADKDDSSSTTHRYLVGGVCFELSGNVQATGQAATVTEPRFGRALAPSQPSLTLNPDARIESALSTSYGAFKTAFELDWSYSTATGPEQIPNLDEATLSYIGFTLGYSDSLMNFWDGDNFQFGASAPNRSSYLLSYQRSLTDDLTLAVAIEAGPPSSRGADTWRLPDTPPYFTMRLRYEEDDWTLHASVAVHELEARGPPLLTGPTERRTGWAASTGVTAPFKFVADDDAASMQVTYAVDSSIFLGIQSDVSYLAAIIPTTGPTTGWSAVASYLHNWNDDWTSNIFVSELNLNLDLIVAHPSVRTTRLGANLIYQINDHWQVGAELDYIDARIDVDGIFGLINGKNLSGATGYLWTKWEL